MRKNIQSIIRALTTRIPNNINSQNINNIANISSGFKNYSNDQGGSNKNLNQEPNNSNNKFFTNKLNGLNMSIEDRIKAVVNSKIILIGCADGRSSDAIDKIDRMLNPVLLLRNPGTLFGTSEDLGMNLKLPEGGKVVLVQHTDCAALKGIKEGVQAQHLDHAYNLLSDDEKEGLKTMDEDKIMTLMRDKTDEAISNSSKNIKGKIQVEYLIHDIEQKKIYQLGKEGNKIPLCDLETGKIYEKNTIYGQIKADQNNNKGQEL